MGTRTGLFKVGYGDKPLPKEVNEFHTDSDKDSSNLAQHHTLGWKTFQAAPGSLTDSRLRELEAGGGGTGGGVSQEDFDALVTTVANLTTRVEALEGGGGATPSTWDYGFENGTDNTEITIANSGEAWAFEPKAEYSATKAKTGSLSSYGIGTTDDPSGILNKQVDTVTPPVAVSAWFNVESNPTGTIAGGGSTVTGMYIVPDYSTVCFASYIVDYVDLSVDLVIRDASFAIVYQETLPFAIAEDVWYKATHTFTADGVVTELKDATEFTVYTYTHAADLSACTSVILEAYPHGAPHKLEIWIDDMHVEWF